MAPRDFSETGAVGAGSGAGASPQGGGSAATTGAISDAVSGAGGGQLAYAPTGGGGSPFEMPTAPRRNYGAGEINPNARPGLGGPQDTTGITDWGRQFLQNTGGFQTMSFAEGGAIPAEEDAVSQPNGLMDVIGKAMGTVQEVLAYGRKKHGIGAAQAAEGDEGAIPGAQAGMTQMPTRPGTQSESGVKPLQPAPGKLPPTDNPFGKRAEADTGGAIDTDEEEMA